MLKVWTCTDFRTNGSARGAAMVVAENEDDARTYLRDALDLWDLYDQDWSCLTVTPVPMSDGHYAVLSDGSTLADGDY